MKKIIKSILIVLFICLSFVLTGCSGQRKLEKALEEIEEKSYTVKGTMRLDLSVSYLGQSQHQTIVSDMMIEADPTHSYSVTTTEGNSQYSYAIIEGNNVKVYQKALKEWELVESPSIDEYKDSNELFDIDVEDNFVKEDGKWVANITNIQDELDGYMEKLAEQFGGIGVEIKKMVVDKYVIELDGKHVSKIEIAMTMEMSSYGVNMVMNISMPMEFSKIGETDVTVPYDLSL